MHNIPITYLATGQAEEVYIRHDYKRERIEQECRTLAVEIAMEIAPVSKPGQRILVAYGREASPDMTDDEVALFNSLTV